MILNECKYVCFHFLRPANKWIKLDVWVGIWFWCYCQITTAQTLVLHHWGKIATRLYCFLYFCGLWGSRHTLYRFMHITVGEMMTFRLYNVYPVHYICIELLLTSAGTKVKLKLIYPTMLSSSYFSKYPKMSQNIFFWNNVPIFIFHLLYITHCYPLKTPQNTLSKYENMKARSSETLNTHFHHWDISTWTKVINAVALKTKTEKQAIQLLLKVMRGIWTTDDSFFEG